MRKFRLLAVPLIASLILFAACGGGDGDTIKVPGGGEVSVSGDLPDNFPDDLPRYGGAKVTGSYTASEGDVEGTAVIFETGDSIDDVIAFYADAFKDGPWELISNTSASGMGSFAVQNDDLSAYIIIGEADDKTSITITYGTRDDLGSGGSSGDDDSGDGSSSGGDSSSGDGDSSSGGGGGSSQLPDEVELDDNFPSNISFPSGSRVTGSSSITSGDFSTNFAEIYVRESVADVKAHFENELSDAGYTQAVSSTTDGEVFLSYTEGDGSSGRGVIVGIGESGIVGYTIVTITVSGGQ